MKTQKQKNTYAIFGISALLLSLICLSAVANIETTTNSNDNLPIGTIVMFTGDNTSFDNFGWMLDENYSGWHMCNGLNDSEDLRSSVPVGYNDSSSKFENMGLSYGNNSYTLTLSEMPQHTHSYTKYSVLQNVYQGTGTLISNLWRITVSRDTSSVGDGKAFDNMQKSVVVNFIQKMS